MTTISYTEARDNLASLWDRTVSTCEPVMLVTTSLSLPNRITAPLPLPPFPFMITNDCCT